MWARQWARWLLVGGLLTVSVGGGLAWWQRSALQTWYALYQFDHATEATRPTAIRTVAQVGEAVWPQLLERLGTATPTTALAVRSVWEQSAATEAEDAPGRGRLLSQFAQQLAAATPAGQQVMLDLAIAWEGPTWAELRRDLVVAGLRSDDADTCVLAICLAMRPSVQMWEPVAPLVKAGQPEVRRAALLAVGPHRDALSDEDVLPCLHDADSETRQLAETALRSRGLTDRDILLGKLICHPDASQRLTLLLHLQRNDDLDVALWLERLTQDLDPAVRIGAARLAVQRQLGFAAQLQHLADADPDATVRQVAQYYLRQANDVQPVRYAR
jgi:hypothetical protein